MSEVSGADHPSRQKEPDTMTKSEKTEMLTIGRAFGLGITWTPKKRILARDVEGVGKAGDVVLAGFASDGLRMWDTKIKWVRTLHVLDIVR